MTEAEIESKLAGVYKTTEGIKKARSLLDEMLQKDQQTCTTISTKWSEAGCTQSTTCADAGAKTACCDGTSVKTKCDDSPSDWRKAAGGADKDDCCDVCVTEPTDKTSNAYKFYEDKCAGQVGLGGRITVCNKLKYTKANGAEDEKEIPADPIAYVTECSTSGNLVVEPEEEEVDGVKTGVTKCGLTSADFTRIIDCFTDSNKLKATSEKTFKADKNKLAKADLDAVDKLMSGMPTYLMIGATVAGKDYDASDLPDGATKKQYEKAKITVPGTKDSSGASCQVAIAKPYLNADLEMQGYDAFVYDPTTYAGSTILFAGTSSATVVSGKNAADIVATTSGTVVIHNVENSGKLDATGLKGALLSSIKNSGMVTLTNVEGNAIYIDNTGTVDIKGTSSISVRFCSQKGTVTLGDDVEGTMYVPVGHTSPTSVPSGVTVKVVPDDGCLTGPKGPWSEWSTCSCDNTNDITRTRTVGDDTQTEMSPCILDEECPGVAGAAPAKVEMELTGDGFWDWVEANMELFKSSLTSDIAATLLVAEDKINDITAALKANVLLKAASARPALLADQTVDVTFVIASGASNALTPLQLAKYYQSAVNNGTANFSSTQSASGIAVSAEVTNVGETTAVGQGVGGIILLAAIVIIGLASIACVFCIIKKRCGKPAKSMQVENDAKASSKVEDNAKQIENEAKSMNL